MDFFLEKCAKPAASAAAATTMSGRRDDSKQFLDTLDDEIMAVISTTTPLSAKDSMKLADRLIDLSSETIERRERVFEERMEQMERKNRILEEKLLMMSTPRPVKTTTTTTMPTSGGGDANNKGADGSIETTEEEDAVQKTLFSARQQQEETSSTTTTTTTTSSHHHLPSHTPGIPSISLSPPRGQTMRADSSEFSPPFSNSRRYMNNSNSNNFYTSRSSLRSATPLSFRNKENILMRKLAAAASSSTMKENDPQQSLLDAAERTMAQSVDDLQNLKIANDALRNELENVKKQRDVDAETHRKALSESNALRASETAKLSESVEILRGEKRLLEQRDEKARNDRDSVMKELSDLKAKFASNELDLKSKSSEIAHLNAAVDEEKGKLKALAEKCADIERTKNEVESKFEVAKNEKTKLAEESEQLRDANDALRKELSEAQHASKKVFESRIVSEREISDLKASLESTRQELDKEIEKRHLAEENVKAIETVKEDIERAASIARTAFEKKVEKLQTKDGTFQEKLKLVNEKREKQNNETRRALEEMTQQCREAVEKAETLNDELNSTTKRLDDSKAECARLKIEQAEKTKECLDAIEQKNKYEDLCRKLELDVARVPGLEFAADAANEEVKALRQKQLEDQAKFSDLEQIEFQLREIIDRGRKETLKLVERGKKAEEEMVKFENMADDLRFKLEQVELSEAMLKKENEERKSELSEIKNASEKFREEKDRLENELERITSAKLELENELASIANASENNDKNMAHVASPAGKVSAKAAVQKISQKLADAQADFKWLQNEHEKVHARLRASEEAQKASRATVVAKTKNMVMLKLRGSSLEGKLEKALAEIKRLEDTVAAKAAEITAIKLKGTANSGGRSFFGGSKKSPTKSQPEKTYEEKRMDGFNAFEEKLAIAKLERDIERLEERHAEQMRTLEAELIASKQECVEAKQYADEVVEKANEEVQHAHDREVSAKRLAEEETKRARFERDSMAQTKLRAEVALENAAEKMRKLELELGRKPIEMPLVSTIPLASNTSTNKAAAVTTTTTNRKKGMRNTSHMFLAIVVVPILFVYLVLVFVSYRLSSPPNASDAAYDILPHASSESGGTCSPGRHFVSMFEEALTNVAGIEYVNRCAMSGAIV
jgi:hypothetical protein